jgi:uncharacterized protein (TIGR02722 family)
MELRLNKMTFFKALTASVAAVSIIGCTSFKAQRVNDQEADEKAMAVTDKWVNGDTKIVVENTIKKVYSHKAFKKYQDKKNKSEVKLFVGEIQNNTSEAYLPVNDIEEALLDQLSNSDTFVLIDAAARDKLLKEISYQNDGMVDPGQAKSIGKASGADVIIYGTVNMKPEIRDGKTIKNYAVNFRLTDLESGEEVCRTREVVNKYSEQSGAGW